MSEDDRPRQNKAHTTSPPQSGASDLTRPQVMRAMRLWMVEGSSTTVYAALTTGNLQTAFALFLGCNNFILGVIAGIGPVVGLLQLVSSYFTRNLGSRRNFTTYWSFVSRLMWIPMLAIPFVLPRSGWVPAFIALTFVSLSLASVTGLTWQDLMGDLIPADKRGRYFGVRNAYVGITAIVVSVGGGVFLDQATRVRHHSEAYAFAVLFVTACCFAALSLLLGSSAPEPSAHRQDNPTKGLSAALVAYSAPLKDRRFRSVILFTVALAGVQAFTGPFFTTYQLQYMKMDYATLQGLGAFAQISSLLAMPVCGYLADKYGNKPILILCTLLILPIPVIWCFTTPLSGPGAAFIGGKGLATTSELIVVGINLVAGFGWAGIGQTQFNLVLAAAPRESRAIYLSAAAAIAGIVGGISPLLGGAIMQELSTVAFPSHGIVRSNFHVLFIASSVLRAGLLITAYGLVEPASRSARYVLGQLKTTNPVGTATALQRLSRSAQQETREKAASELGRLKAPIAVEELVKALDDVALPVRERAAEALGEIGDSRAVSPLVSKLQDAGAGIATEAAVALGKIGDSAALHPLMYAARHVDNLTSRRIAAIEGIGTLPHSEAVDGLLELIDDPDPAIRMSVIRAISLRPDMQGSGDLSHALLDQWEREEDPSILPLIADALAQLGNRSLAPVLVLGLTRIESQVGRREILNAVGSLIGGRDSFYAYLALDRYAADDTVTKILSTLLRQLRPSSTSEDTWLSARAAVRVRQALEAYIDEQFSLCAKRIGQAAVLVYKSRQFVVEMHSDIDVRTILELQEITSQGLISVDDILLLVFMIRHLSAPNGF